jgi:hypothetical protein
MTDRTMEQQPADSAETAMNRVLEAEQAAAAQQRARRIASRTDERIALIDQRIRQQLQQRLAEAERAERRAELEREHDHRAALVASVVTGLAAGLTGDSDGD